MCAEQWHPNERYDFTGARIFSKYMKACLDVAWAAGLFEGEGWVTASKVVRGEFTYRNVTIGISMTDEDTIRKFAGILESFLEEPINIHKRDYTSEKHKAQWYFAVTGRSKAGKVLSAFWPWLSKRRKAKVLEVMNLSAPQGQRKGSMHPKSKLTDADVLAIRELYSKGQVTQRELAKMFNVEKSNIQYITSEKGWRHLL